MKRVHLFIGVVSAFFMLASISSFADIKNSKHDFSSKAWAANQICIVCHTPHNSDASITQAPLWNHTTTTATFTMYSNANTLDGVVDNTPNPISKMCLSCHDGVTAIDSYGGASGTILLNTTNFPGTKANLGSSLANDHPISMTFTSSTATADKELWDPSTTSVTDLGGTIKDKMLFNDKIECASCHDVHNSGTSSTHGKMLLLSNTASALCLTCHKK
jgi:predicted CXXCH cytochrome family protein